MMEKCNIKQGDWVRIKPIEWWKTKIGDPNIKEAKNIDQSQPPIYVFEDAIISERGVRSCAGKKYKVFQILTSHKIEDILGIFIVDDNTVYNFPLCAIDIISNKLKFNEAEDW